MAFQFHFQSGKQRKVGTTIKLFLVKEKSPGEKGDVRRCVVMMQQPVLLSSKFGMKFSHFHAVVVKHNSSMWN
jgi:hypothetical protein